MAGNACKKNKKNTIIPRDFILAIYNDEELNKLFSSSDILNGGVLPNIHNVLLTKKRSGGNDENYLSEGGVSKGLGPSGVRRHRKILRDNIHGDAEPAIRRLAHRGGVKFMSGLIYEETRSVVKVYLENLISDIITLRDYKGVKL